MRRTDLPAFLGPKIPRKWLLVHRWRFADRMKIESPGTYLDVLLGRLTFWRWVESDNRFLERHYDDFAAICAEFRRIAGRL